MLRSLRLQNFRSLRDTQDVPLRPIVLLVGANSAGKSSLLRFFPLLKQTAQANSRSPLLWFREERGYVDFGDFDKTLFRGASTPEIIISGVLEASGINSINESANYRFTASVAAHEGRSFVHRFELSTLGDTVTFELDHGRKIRSVNLNSDPVKDPFIQIIGKQVPVDMLLPSVQASSLLDLAEVRLASRISEQVHGRTGMWKLGDIANSIEYGSPHAVHSSMLRVYGGVKTWKDNISAISESAPYIQQIKELALLRLLGDTGPNNPLDRIKDSLRDLALGVRYIGPFRHAPARFYRQQEIAVDEMDPAGSNLAMFLHSLDEHARVAFSEWIFQHFGFHVRAESRGVHVVLQVSSGTDSRFDLTDMGFGISQLLPVAAQCWLSSRDRGIERRHAPSILAVEQPELHLHPYHQAQLADMFASLVSAANTRKYPLSLFVETHSEAMIYRLGELVESGRLPREDILILFFEKLTDRDESSVRFIEFDETGVLRDWPVGFFRA